MENNINYAVLSLDEIIFIDRNKAYGAFDLRRSYNENVKRALLGTILFTSFAIGVQQLLAARHPLAVKPDIEVSAKPTDLTDIVIPPPPPPKPELPLPKGSTEAATQAFAELRPADDNSATDSVAPIDPDVVISDHTQAGIKGEKPGVENGSDVEIHVAAPPAEIQTVTIAEEMPEFPGGEDALIRHIRNNLRYPEYENELGIQGKAVVGFIVDENGKVTDVKMLKGVSKGIDRESMRVISSLPKFTPGKQSGRNVRVRFVIPLDFHQKGE